MGHGGNSNPQLQKLAFLDTEGDRYFDRNGGRASSPVLAGFYSKYIKSGYRVLEIGCSSGESLARLCSLSDSICFGIDPSEKAIGGGRKSYPNLQLFVGTADELPFDDYYFDFVLFGFCLYLIDRHLLPRAVAEADRVLKERAYLGITDFDCKVPIIKPYKHRPGINSYKQDYSLLFTAFPQYTMVDKVSFSHSGDRFVDDPNERLAAVLLYKDGENAYLRG
jgi:SAM-dependent methyltransferase